MFFCAKFNVDCSKLIWLNLITLANFQHNISKTRQCSITLAIPNNIGKTCQNLAIFNNFGKIWQNYVYDLGGVSTFPSFQALTPTIKRALSSSSSPFYLQAHYRGGLKQFDNPYLWIVQLWRGREGFLFYFWS